MAQDISDFLSFEIKKELADRYFGFRRLIEEDKEAFAAKVREQEISVGQRICRDLVRIYILLQDEELIREFLGITGLDEKLFFDPYFLESATIRQRVFKGVRPRGLTSAGKFKNLLLDCYEELEAHVSQYRERFSKLLEERRVISEEIRLFYKKNDIGGIMDFLRRLDAPAATGPMDLGGAVGGEDHFSRKMRLEPPPPVESLLTIIPPVPSLPRIRHLLKSLADKAYARHGRRLLAAILG